MSATQASFNFDAPRRRLPDACRHKHGGDANSEAANERIHQWKPFWEDKIRNLLKAAGPNGMTSTEIAIRLGSVEKPVAKNVFSGRLRDMYDAGEVNRPGKREGEWIHVHHKFEQ